jgi:hypothetical protein
MGRTMISKTPPSEPISARTERRHLELFGPGYRPVRCPECSSSRIAPLFVEWMDGYDCDDCYAVFSWGTDG